MLTVQRAESGGVVHVEFVGRVSGARSVIKEWHRGRASWPGLRDVGWQPQMLQHAPNDGGILDERDELEPPRRHDGVQEDSPVGRVGFDVAKSRRPDEDTPNEPRVHPGVRRRATWTENQWPKDTRDPLNVSCR